MSLGGALAEANRLLESADPDREERLLELCARDLGQAFGSDDALQVAVLRLIDGEEFTFAWPRELRPGNRFPVGPSLAGRALRSGALIENAVPKRPHFGLYERIPRAGAPAAPIQRMLALPIPGVDGPLGVVQVSRAGHTPEAAGPGFTGADADRLVAGLERWAPLLARLWKTRTAQS
jgi:hypothetical protein